MFIELHTHSKAAGFGFSGEGKPIAGPKISSGSINSMTPRGTKNVG